MGLLYGYLFPLIFLVAFWVLYRHENVPLLRHMGELLTVSVLGGACFGLPTTLVSERERGVWRRYRLAPVPTWAVVTSTVVARYLIVLTAGMLQIGLALAIGMTLPAHPFDLWVAFTMVSFALIGLGLVIAMMADNVPAVQALGQCIFLPMLIIGGVAVQLASLPEWAQHVSAFFPGRYAVEAMQAGVTGNGIMGARFSLLALGLIGVAGCLAGAKLFRWDAQQRFAARTGKLWLFPVLAAWLAVGFLAEYRGRIAVGADAPLKKVKVVPKPAAPLPAPVPAVVPTPPVVVPREAPPPAVPTPVATPPAPTPAPTPAPVASTPASSPASAAPMEPRSWTDITAAHVAGLNYRVPPDNGVVSPIAPAEEEPDEYVKKQLDGVREKLPGWGPGVEPDDVQRVRNILYVAAVPDTIQLPVESYTPLVVLERLTDIYPADKLVKLLTWIAMHPLEGGVIDDISELGIEGAAGDPMQVRERAYLYAIKFVARLTGKGPR